MKIALACDWFLPRVGGIETHLSDLAIRLRNRGHDVHVVTTTRGPSVVNGIAVHRVPARLFPRSGFAYNPGALAAMRRIIRAERFDVLHAHASIVSPAAYGSAVASMAHGTPTLLSFHSVLRNHAWWLRHVVRRLALPARGATFAAVSAVVAREAAEMLDAPRVDVLPNGIDAEFWRARREIGGSGEPLVVSVLRLEPKKRPRALIRMLARLRDSIPRQPFRVRIVGDGSERPAVERLVTQLGLGDIVELCGRVSREEIRALHARADVFVLPTRLEALGIAVLEARAAGLPVVIMREAGAAELLEHGRDGLLAASDDDMVAALASLLSDSTLRARITAHNSSVAPPAAWPGVLSEHERVYRGLVKRDGG